MNREGVEQHHPGKIESFHPSGQSIQEHTGRFSIFEKHLECALIVQATEEVVGQPALWNLEKTKVCRNLGPAQVLTIVLSLFKASPHILRTSCTTTKKCLPQKNYLPDTMTPPPLLGVAGGQGSRFNLADLSRTKCSCCILETHNSIVVNFLVFDCTFTTLRYSCCGRRQGKEGCKKKWACCRSKSYFRYQHHIH